MRPSIVVGPTGRAPWAGGSGSVRLTRTGFTWAISNLGETVARLPAPSAGGALRAGARAAAAWRFGVAAEGCAATVTLRLRVCSLAPLTSPILSSARMLVLRAAAV